MDILSIIKDTDRYNFHTHTQFCDGRNSVADMAAAAVADGFLHIGFSPHSPIIIESPCNMLPVDVPAYKAEVEKANIAADGRCRFYTGMEIDYLGPDYGPASEYFRNLGLDYAIGSVHFIRNRRGEYVDIDGSFDSFQRKMDKYFDNDIRYVVEEYYRASSEMLAAGGFDILGHFDKIGQNAGYYQTGIEDEDWYQQLVADYISRIIESGIIVEINTKARIDHNRFFPGLRYWQRLVDAGVPLVVNSDAHYASKIDASRSEALQILDSLRK